MSFVKVADLDGKEFVPGFIGRVVHNTKITQVFWDVAKGAVAQEHTHPHEQFANVLEGEFEFNLAGETRVLRPGDVVVIPANVPHGGWAVSACRLLDVFCPTRDDLK